MPSGTFSVLHKASFHFLIHGSFPNTHQAFTHRGDLPVLLPLSGMPLLPTAPAPLRSHGNILVFQNWV